MANTYQGFTNPTIIPDQKYGWEAASQGVGDATKTIGDYLAARQAETRGLQLGQAQEFGKAQADVWAKMQDPMARAAAYANLAMRGYPMQVIDQKMKEMDAQYGPQSMGNMLQGNPYAKYVMGGQSPSMDQGQQGGQPSSVPQPVGAQASPTMDFSPLAAGNPVMSSSPSNMVQETHKVGPFGTEPERQFTDVNASGQVAGNKSYAEQVGGAQGKQATATSMLDNITRNLAADLKSHFAEAGGGGPIKGRIAGFSTNFGMSPATAGLKNTIRDSAIAYARDLAGGSQGVQRMFQAIMETIPGPGATQEQAGTALLQMHLTAAQLQAGMSALGLNPQDLSGMNEQQIQAVMAKGNIDRQAETEKFSKIMSEIQPTKVMDMSGKLSDPQVNPILGAFGQGQFQAPSSQKTGSAANKQLDANTAKQMLQKAGGDKDKARQIAKQQGYTF